MKRLLALLVLLLAWSNARPVLAQEPAADEIELVRQLRAKGWFDLARQRIDLLMLRPDPVLKADLPLESARIDIAEARQKDPDQRIAFFIKARAKLQEAINKNPGKAQGALAAVESARVASYHAQALLLKALREEDAKSRHRAARPAEIMFVQAGKDLETAMKSIEKALADTGNAAFKPRLEQELKQTRFDIAINLFDQARTFINRSNPTVDEQRTALMGKAKAAFVALRSDESSEVGWLANAWLMKCAMETTNPDEVVHYHNFVMTRKDRKDAQPSIQPAVRLVRYFAIQDVTPRADDTETIGNNALAAALKLKQSRQQRLHTVETNAEAWLKAYPSALRTYEGQGTLYELGNAYFLEGFEPEAALEEAKATQAAALEKEKKAKADIENAADEKEKKAATAALAAAQKEKKAATAAIPALTATATAAAVNYDKAALYFDKLAELDGDLAERASRMSEEIKIKRLGTKGELKTFDEFRMKGMEERKTVIILSGKLDANETKIADAKDDKTRNELKSANKKLETERKQHLKDVIAALGKAQSLATTKTPVRKLDDVLYYLSGAYLAYGDPYRAAVVAESLGRAHATRRASEGAATAIQTYSALQAQHPDDAGIRHRLHTMTEFVLANDAWKGEPVASMAHYHMGMAYQRDNNPRKAIEHLSKIDKEFGDYIYTQGQIVFICEAARSATDNKKEQKEFADLARKAIARMPKFDVKNDSPSTITMYFFAKLELAKYLYADAMELDASQTLKAIKQCEEMKAYVNGLRNEFDALPGKIISDPKNREQLEFTMQTMLKYGDFGIAETKFRSNAATRFDDVLAATKSVVEGVLEKTKAVPAGEPIRLKDYRLTGDILGLALRANVQKGDVVKGKAILDVLQRLSGPNEGDKPGPVVAVLLNDIAGQIQRLKKDNDKSLKATTANYTAFLDVIAKEYETKGFDNNAAILLAHAYSSLDYHAKAATLFSKVQAPAGLDKKIEKKKEETPAETKARENWEESSKRYWGVQIEYIRALRNSKDKESLAKAEKAVDALIANKAASFTILALMEKNFILEDTERYRNAYAQWGKFMKIPSISGSNLGQKDIQQIYFKAYFYQVRTFYKIGILDNETPKIKDPQKIIDGAATMMIRLEFAKTKEGWEIAKPMFDEYFKEKEADKLKKAYDAQKVLRLKGAMLPEPRRGVRPAIVWIERRRSDVRVLSLWSPRIAVAIA